MARVVVFAVSLTLWASAVALADPVQIRGVFVGAQVSFGSPSTDGAVYGEGDFNSLDLLPCATGLCARRFQFGLMEIVSGPLLGVALVGTPGSPSTRYTYAPGSITLEAEWLSKGLVTRGGFVAPILFSTFDVFEGDNPQDVLTFTEIALGPGLFDTAFASYLGVLPNTAGGRFGFDLDFIHGAPETERWGAWNYAPLDITASSVPEPAPIAMGLLAVAGMLLGRCKIARA